MPRTKPAGQSCAVTTGAFDAHLAKLAIRTCPANQLGKAARGRRDRAGAQQSATLIERRSHMLLGMRIYPERHTLRLLYRVSHCSPPYLVLSAVGAHQPGRRTDLRWDRSQALIRSRSSRAGGTVEVLAADGRQIVSQAQGRGTVESDRLNEHLSHILAGALLLREVEVERKAGLDGAKEGLDLRRRGRG